MKFIAGVLGVDVDLERVATLGLGSVIDGLCYVLVMNVNVSGQVSTYHSGRHPVTSERTAIKAVLGAIETTKK